MKLSEALREAASRVNSSGQYDFLDAGRCNCGILAQVLLGVDGNQIACATRYNLIGAWAASVYQHGWHLCPVSAIPAGNIVRRLAEAGCRPIDLAELESLENPAVRERAGLLPDHPSNADDCFTPETVSRYMRAWADLIDEKEQEEAYFAGDIA